MALSQPVPKGLKQVGPGELEITWQDGHVSLYAVRELRLRCPCAVCVDEWTGKKILRDDSVAKHVKPKSIEPVGRYALQILWSDGHGTGIYAFDYLRMMCPCGECRK